MDDSLARLQALAVHFRDERDWKQFHRLKDLALGLTAEAGELAELFLWKTDEELALLREDSPERHRLGEELADILMYLLYLADASGLDLAEACRAKIQTNGLKYPVEKARGTARKYTELE